jgi:hypothetical protein
MEKIIQTAEAMYKTLRRGVMKKLLFLCFIFCGIFASANDSFGRGASVGGIIFEKSQDIEMMQEALYLSAGLIEVNYLFKNTSDKDITNEVYFPLPDMNCQSSHDSEGPAYYKFKLWINGKPEDYQTHINIMSGDKDFTEKFKPFFNEYCPTPDERGRCGGPSTKELLDKIKTFTQEEQKLLLEKTNCTFTDEEQTEFCSLNCQMKVAFHWNQTFPAGKTIHIKHSYNPEVASDSSGEYAFGYILKTGANWKGPIKQFNSLISAEDINDSGKDMITTDIKDFTPQEDLEITGISTLYRGSKNPQPVGECVHKEGCAVYKNKKDKYPSCFIERNYYSGTVQAAKWFNRESMYDDLQVLPMSSWESKFFKLGGGGYAVIEEVSENGAVFMAQLQKNNPEAGLPPCKDIFKIKPPYLSRIYGPANLRSEPNGKKTGRLEDKTYVWVLKQMGDWYEVIQGDAVGWTHKGNLINIWEEYDKAGGAI